MPLPVPKLDTRTWEDLTAEGRGLIPRLAPGWTDHNVHDPGITLLELFAWLAEMLLYRSDRVTPALRRSFLRLVGVEPRPRQVAATVVAVRREAPGGPAALDAGTVVADAAGAVRFATRRALDVSPAWLELEPSEQTAHGRLAVEHEGSVLDVTTANRVADRPLLPLGAEPVPGDALRLGFDVPPAEPGRVLSLHVWTATWARDEAEWERLEEAAVECVRPSSEPAATRKDCLRGRKEPEEAAAPIRAELGHPSARIVWEYWAGAAGWRPFPEATDETRALTLSGFVLLTGAPDHVAGPDGNWYWIRCRLAEGEYDCAPALAGIAVNAVSVRHAVAAPVPITLGESRGQARQAYRVPRAPIVPGSVRIDAAGTEWREVPDWDRSGPRDPVFIVEHGTGKVVFGDGREGRVPPAGADVEAQAYEVGGGRDGNVPAGCLARLEGAGLASLQVVQPFPATGGVDVESLERAQGRALDLLGAPTRAVTAEDFERLALQTPGVRVGRAHASPGHHPALPCVHALGVVTVVVLPACGSPPRPSAGFLAAVRRELERRRPLATEVHVVGPTYVPVTVRATLHARCSAPLDLRGRAVRALVDVFDPLTGGGGGGWPFGRDVFESEVLALLAGLPGVAYVDELSLTADGAQLCGNLPLCPTELPALEPPLITVLEETRA